MHDAGGPGVAPFGGPGGGGKPVVLGSQGGIEEVVVEGRYLADAASILAMDAGLTVRWGRGSEAWRSRVVGEVEGEGMLWLRTRATR